MLSHRTWRQCNVQRSAFDQLEHVLHITCVAVKHTILTTLHNTPHLPTHAMLTVYVQYSSHRAQTGNIITGGGFVFIIYAGTSPLLGAKLVSHAAWLDSLADDIFFLIRHELGITSNACTVVCFMWHRVCDKLAQIYRVRSTMLRIRARAS